MENINVEEIMQQIRADIKARGLEDKEILFDSIAILGGGTGTPYSDEAYKVMLEEVEKNKEVSSYRELLGGAVERFIKKVLRRLVAFYIEPIVDDQNLFNRSVYTGLVMDSSKFAEDTERLDAFEKKLYECEKRIKELEDEFAQYKK